MNNDTFRALKYRVNRIELLIKMASFIELVGVKIKSGEEDPSFIDMYELICINNEADEIDTYDHFKMQIIELISKKIKQLANEIVDVIIKENTNGSEISKEEIGSCQTGQVIPSEKN